MDTTVDKCPFCGGDTGFNRTFCEKYSQWVQWDGQDVSAAHADIKENNMGKCLDCGRRFRLSTIMKD